MRLALACMSVLLMLALCCVGLDPEHILGELAKKTLDYYFMELNAAYTSQMTNIFQKCYPTGPNAPVGFHVIPASTDPGDFMPMVLRSVNMSASRSFSYFSKHTAGIAAPVYSATDDEY